MAGPSVNHVNVPARFSMPPARPLEANASCASTDGSRYCPIYSDYGSLRSDRQSHPTFSKLSTTCHTEPPLEKPQGWSRRCADQTLTGTSFRANARQEGERYRARLRGVARHECPARLPSRDTNSFPSRDTNSRCCTPRERQLVRDRGRSRCTHSIAPIRGLPGSVPDRRAPSIGPREVRTFRFG
jgi:hypothetical protein